MDGALKKAMSISPELRYQDVSEFLYDLQHPNPAFATVEFQPLIQKNPLRFWQLTTLALLVIEIAAIVILS
jgi:eukaryotic-like serine/threonine-protein kinase